MNASSIQLDPIGFIHSPYKEKFAIPRQSGLVTAAKGAIELKAPYNSIDTVRDIEQFSHLWVIFVFHETASQGWHPLVRPPRLGGNKKVGVFATRSTFRPNPIGMSVVKLDSIELKKDNLFIHISGLDLLDKTPVLDIKPYIPYADIIEHAEAGFAQQPPSALFSVNFSTSALQSISQLKIKHPDLQQLIEQVLSQDPRPAYKKQKEDNKLYGIQLYDFNILWRVSHLTEIFVEKIECL